jgi:insulysin
MDGNRIYQLQKTTSNPGHPFHKFGTGNTETLQTIPTTKGINVHEQLLKFHTENYSASLMKLVVLGRDPLDILEDWATKYPLNIVVVRAIVIDDNN